MFIRTLKRNIEEKLYKGKAIILIGPRQTGKTTLIESMLHGKEYLHLDADNPPVRSILNEPNLEELKTLLGKYNIIFIDEAQRIKNIGITLKLITDHFKDIQLIVTGSSAFELNNKLNEPLTGRKWSFQLYPISWEETEITLDYLTAGQQLETRLRFGAYPDVLMHPGEEQEVLNELMESYLFKDILAYGGIRKPDVLEKLLRALAFQVGNEVSYNELAQLVGVDKNTVNNYIQLLEQSYIVFSLGSFSRNLRNEIKSNQKIYFYDNGVRNVVIQNFNTLEFRDDRGALWENFLVAERLKWNKYRKTYAKGYFWRTVQQQEIDYVEEYNGRITGYEFKWGDRSRKKPPAVFRNAYDAEIQVINRQNFRDFVYPDYGQ